MPTPREIVEAAEQEARERGTEALTTFWNGPLGGTDKTHQVYGRYSQTLPVNPSIVFYETMSGSRMGDNPFAIFDYLEKHEEYKDFLHVWSVNDQDSIPRQYRGSDKVVFVHRHSDAYAYFLACAGHIIGNANLPEYFTRRSEQRYLNTWHGIPYKALGRDTPKARFGSWQGAASFLKATHVVTPCQFMTDAVLSAYSMTGTSTALVAETGYPRVDTTIDASAEKTFSLRTILGLGEDQDDVASAKPVVLYAPTWRAEGGKDVVDSEQLLTDLTDLAKLDIHLLYRGHHRMDKKVKDRIVGEKLGNVTIPPHEISSNELLAVVDILITDYSSIFFDFIPTGRPIIHYLYDLDEYAATRGLNLTTDELPGTVAGSRTELLSAVEASAAALAEVPNKADLVAAPLQGERYARAQHRFCPREDGRATERAVNFFFKDYTGETRVRSARDSRPTVVYWAGPSGKDREETKFLRQAIESGRSANVQTTVVIEKNATLRRDSLKGIKALKQNLSTVSYVRTTPLLLPEERSAYKAFAERENLTLRKVQRLLAHDRVLNQLFSREYRRRLDDAHFDNLLLGPGLSNFELAVASYACRPTAIAPDPAATPVPKPALKARLKHHFPHGTRRHQAASKVYRAIGKPAKRVLKGLR
ncbi:MAG: CDP-glycerol glycerophosphotransferase family protein [Ancrocorticia sp.]|uniref:CDP-glycerol glycerophosphotransferase family protein n=1 Tax=Ancrocorticia sp. TaxID=2593684 RepID=UPI003F909625